MDGRGLAFLSPSACWEALSKAEVGHLGVLVNSAPEVYPVNFVVDDIRSLPGR